MKTTAPPREAAGVPLQGTACGRAPAKINLCLRIVGRRHDGYHLLDSLVVPIGIFDRVTIRVLAATEPGIALRCNSPGLGPARENLAVRAADLFLREAGLTLKVTIDLKKKIPVRSGLGGGSSDAATVLLALNAIIGQRFSRARLMELASRLGADVPFFIHGRPARLRDVGNRVEMADSWPSDGLVVAFSGSGLATRDVYRKYDHSLTKIKHASSVPTPIKSRMPLRGGLVNDLEAAAVQIQPVLYALKQRLLELGAWGAVMTGSGSAVFGLWERWEEAQVAAERMQQAGFWARAARILDRAPGVRVS